MSDDKITMNKETSAEQCGSFFVATVCTSWDSDFIVLWRGLGGCLAIYLAEAPGVVGGISQSGNF